MDLEAYSVADPRRLRWKDAPRLVRGLSPILVLQLVIALAFAYLWWRVGHSIWATVVIFVIALLSVPLVIVGMMPLLNRVHSSWTFTEEGIRVRGLNDARIRWTDVAEWGVSDLAEYPGYRELWVRLRGRRSRTALVLGPSSDVEGPRAFLTRFVAGV
jgi:hypothetical protein